MNKKSEVVDAICKEIEMRKDYLTDKSVNTVYFGGGTPSLLSEGELQQIINAISQYFHVNLDAEITLEANPDDLSPQYLALLKSCGINRLSIGVQSFFEEDLAWMNRSHNSDQAFQCIRHAQEEGFSNISIDLIFGSPTSSMEKWEENLKMAAALSVPHISCYGLTVEPRTALKLMIEKNKTIAPREEDYADQFLKTIDLLSDLGYTQYELSNYCREGYVSRHNSNYWKGEHYLGIGPSAHSFNGHSRYWNVAHNIHYLKAMESGYNLGEEEHLSLNDRYNEYVLTGLRTQWGCSLSEIEELGNAFRIFFQNEVTELIQSGDVIENNGNYKLSSKGKLMANEIMSELFIVDE